MNRFCAVASYFVNIQQFCRKVYLVPCYKNEQVLHCCFLLGKPIQQFCRKVYPVHCYKNEQVLHCCFLLGEAYNVQNLFILVARYKVYFPTKLLYIYHDFVGSNSAKPVHSCSNVQGILSYKTIVNLPSRKQQCKTCSFLQQGTRYTFLQNHCIFTKQEATVQNLFILVARYKVYFPTKPLYIYQVGSNSAKPVHSCSNVQGILSYKTIVYSPSRKQQCKTCSFLQQCTGYRVGNNSALFLGTIYNGKLSQETIVYLVPSRKQQCKTCSFLQQGTRYTFLQKSCIFAKQEAPVQNLFILVARYKVYFPTKPLYIYQIGGNSAKPVHSCSKVQGILTYKIIVYLPSRKRQCETCSILQQGTRYTFLQNHCIFTKQECYKGMTHSVGSKTCSFLQQCTRYTFLQNYCIFTKQEATVQNLFILVARYKVYFPTKLLYIYQVGSNSAKPVHSCSKVQGILSYKTIVYLPSRKRQCKTCSFLQQGTRYTFLQNHCIFTKQEATVQNLFILVATYKVYFPTKPLYIYQVGSRQCKTCSFLQQGTFLQNWYTYNYKTRYTCIFTKQEATVQNLFILVARYKVYFPTKYIVYLPSRKQQCKTCSFLQQGTRYTFLQNYCIFATTSMKQQCKVYLFILVARYKVYFPTKPLYIYQVGSNSAKPVHSCSKVQGILSYKTIVNLPSRKQQCKTCSFLQQGTRYTFLQNYCIFTKQEATVQNLFILVARYKVYFPTKSLYILPSRKQQCKTCSFLQQATRYTFLQNHCIFTKQEATVQNLFILVARYKVYFPTKLLYIYQVGSNSAKPVHSCSKVQGIHKTIVYLPSRNQQCKTCSFVQQGTRYTFLQNHCCTLLPSRMQQVKLFLQNYTKCIFTKQESTVQNLFILVARYRVCTFLQNYCIFTKQEATVQNLFILVAMYRVYFPTKLLYIYQVGSKSAKPVHSCSKVQGILSYKTIVYLPSRKQQCKTCSFLQQGTRYTFLQNYCIFTKQEATVQNLFFLFFPTKSLQQQCTRYTFLQNHCIFTKQEAKPVHSVQNLLLHSCSKVQGILSYKTTLYICYIVCCIPTKQVSNSAKPVHSCSKVQGILSYNLLLYTFTLQEGFALYASKSCTVYLPNSKTCSFLQQCTRYTFLQNHCKFTKQEATVQNLFILVARYKVYFPTKLLYIYQVGSNSAKPVHSCSKV